MIDPSDLILIIPSLFFFFLAFSVILPRYEKEIYAEKPSLATHFRLEKLLLNLVFT